MSDKDSTLRATTVLQRKIYGVQSDFEGTQLRFSEIHMDCCSPASRYVCHNVKAAPCSHSHLVSPVHLEQLRISLSAFVCMADLVRLI